MNTDYNTLVYISIGIVFVMSFIYAFLSSDDMKILDILFYTAFFITIFVYFSFFELYILVLIIIIICIIIYYKLIKKSE